MICWHAFMTPAKELCSSETSGSCARVSDARELGWTSVYASMRLCEHLLLWQKAFCGLQRLFDTRGILAAGGGEVGLAAASALDVTRKLAYDVAGVQPA